MYSPVSCFCLVTFFFLLQVNGPSTECVSLFLVQIPGSEASEYKERLRVVAATRAAQRGVECSENMIKDLLSGVVTAQDIVEIVDLHPYNGDLSMAICRLRMSGSLKCKLRCWMVDIPGKNCTQAAFSIKRRGWIPQKDPKYLAVHYM